MKQIISKGNSIVLRFPVKNFDGRVVTKSERAEIPVHSGDSCVYVVEVGSTRGERKRVEVACLF